MSCFTFLSAKCLKSSEYSTPTAHLNTTGHILNALWPHVASGTARGSTGPGAAESGLWRHHVAVAGTPPTGPHWLKRELQLLFPEIQVSELESPPKAF